MYGNEFWKRVNLRQVGEFLRRGSELPRNLKEGTAEEQYKKLTNDFYDGLHKFRDKVLAHDWSKCDEKDKEIITEGFWEDIIDAGGNLQELAFDVGLQAGLSLGFETKQHKNK